MEGSSRRIVRSSQWVDRPVGMFLAASNRRMEPTHSRLPGRFVAHGFLAWGLMLYVVTGLLTVWFSADARQLR